MSYVYNEAHIIKETSYGYSQIALKDDMLSKRQIEFVGEINADSVNALIREILYLERQDPNAEITIYINSPGGSALKLKAVSEDLMETRRIVADVIAKHSGKTTEEILEKTSSDCYFRAAEAIEFGLADNIITSI